MSVRGLPDAVHREECDAMSSETEAPTTAVDDDTRQSPAASARVRILAGVPGYPGMRVPSGRYAYPDTTDAIAARLRAAGFSVTVQHPEDEREPVLPKGPEVWIPLLEVSRDLLIATTGGLLTEIILRVFRDAQQDADHQQQQPAPDPDPARDVDGARQAEGQLRVEWQVKDAEGAERTFRASGPPEAVVLSIEQFVRQDSPPSSE